MKDVILKRGCADCDIFADLLFEKIFYNLINNTLRYGGEDDGTGIAAGDEKRPFTQCFGKHTGLDLFLSHEISSITRITIRETGEPGKGARFEITVPK